MNQPSDPLLSIRDLKVHFFMDEGVVRAVDGVSLDVYPGQVFGIVGESGCGKSVTMKALLRIVEPPGRIVSGEMLLRRTNKKGAAPDIVDLAKLDARGQEMRDIRGGQIALIPQEPMAAFSPVHTVGNQIMEAIQLHRNVDKKEARAIALQQLKDVGIPEAEQRLDAYSWQLSGGLRQRAMIAMALSCNPALLIADEPTTAVDVTTQAQVLRLLRRLQEERNSAIIFITHDLGVIAQVAHYVTVMYLGVVVEQGPVDDIFHNPKHPYTQALLKSIPSIDMTARADLPTIKGSIPHPFNRPAGCPFYPRCARFMQGKCDKEIPALLAVDDRQRVSCFLYHDQPAEAAPVTASVEAAL
ncbi:MAG: ABC transporter ATP-binding protein [Anaerolineae bacterium]|jgi:peptide/nickel transport system ATP-binding protein|nr:ABC transporter ATP-binding protein [Anaerolineae bacterium]